MLFLIRDILYAAAIISGLGAVYTTLGTLNGRLPGGLTPHNLPWAISLAVLVPAVVGLAVLKLIFLARRRHARPFRAHRSGHGWVQDPERPD